MMTSSYDHYLTTIQVTEILAHLSRRLTPWPLWHGNLIVYSKTPSSLHPSVVRPRISLRPDGLSRPHFICSIYREREQLLYVLGQIISKLWLPWQQKALIDLYGVNYVSKLASSFLIRSLSNLQITSQGIKPRTSSYYGLIWLFTLDWFTLGAENFSHRLITVIWRKCCIRDNVFTLNQIFFQFADNQDRHSISDEFEFWLDLTMEWEILV